MNSLIIRAGVPQEIGRQSEVFKPRMLEIKPGEILEVKSQGGGLLNMARVTGITKRGNAEYMQITMIA